MVDPKAMGAAIVLSCAEIQAQTNTVVNGGFEDPGTTGSVSSVPATPMPGWAVTRGNVEIIGLPTCATAEGEQSRDLNGVPRGTIQQTVSGFTVENDYELRFDMGGNVYGGSRTTFAAVSIGNTTDSFSYTRVSGESVSNVN